MERKQFRTRSATVTHEEKPQEVYQRVLNWFKRHECFSGESVMQCDAPQLTAASLLSDLADEVFNFDVKWDDDFDD